MAVLRIITALAVTAALPSAAAAGSAAAPPPGVNGDMYSPFGVAKTAYDLVLEKLQERHEAVTALGNATAGWVQRQDEVRASLHELFAPLPPPNRSKTPSFVDGGNTSGDGFIVRKLLVETRPGYYASAGLFLPNEQQQATHNKGRPIPAVLFPSGHSDLAWREPAAQLVAINLVKRGIAVLGYDPIGQGERRMLPDLDGSGGSPLNGTDAFSPSMEHEYVQRVSSLNGVNAASAWVWDMMILVDFLESSVPGIDPKRLGVAGCSGGGVQSAYLGAIDERLVAASIACYTSTLTVDYAPSVGLPFIGGGGPAEGEQQWGPFVGAGSTKLDKPDLLTVRAPKPTQVLLTTRDQYFPMVGGKAAVSEAMPAFEALSGGSGGAPALTMTVGNNTHGYINKTRLALYAFFSTHLLHTADSGIEHQPSAFFGFEDVRCTSTGSVLTAPELNHGRGSVSAHEAFVLPRTRENLDALEEKRTNHPADFLRSVSSSAAEVVGFKPLITPAPKAHRLGNVTNGTMMMMQFALPGEGRCEIGLEVHLPPAAAAAPHHDDDSDLGLAGEGGKAGGGRRVPQQQQQQGQKAVLYVSRKGSELARPRPGQLSELEQARLASVRAAGFAVVLVDVCGFGTLADHAGDAFGLFDLPSHDYRTKESHPVDAMYNVGRSLVGLHAADVLRAARWTQDVMKMRVVATVSANETAAAVLAAALISTASTAGEAAHGSNVAGGRAVAMAAAPPLGNIAVVSSVVSWSSMALSPRYDMSAYYSFVFAGLKHFDLPDMAAALNVSVLVVQPLDALRRPLNQSAAAAAFKFSKASNSQLKVHAGAGAGAGITATLVQWLLAAQR